MVMRGTDDYVGHIEYSEVTDWSKIFNGVINTGAADGWYSYQKDQVGTIYKVYSQRDRAFVDTCTYDVFGNKINQTDTTRTNLGFQGKYYDTESGLYYFYQRYYSTNAGRFTNEDPIQFDGGINFYSFVENNPIYLTDPMGTSPFTGALPWLGRALTKANPYLLGAGLAIDGYLLARRLWKKPKAKPDSGETREGSLQPIPPPTCKPEMDCVKLCLKATRNFFLIPLCLLCMHITGQL